MQTLAAHVFGRTRVVGSMNAYLNMHGPMKDAGWDSAICCLENENFSMEWSGFLLVGPSHDRPIMGHDSGKS